MERSEVPHKFITSTDSELCQPKKMDRGEESAGTWGMDNDKALTVNGHNVEWVET